MTQFDRIIETYDKVHDRVLSSIFQLQRQFHYRRLEGCTVLDVGNGGQPPEKMLGTDITTMVKKFVGFDNSPAMLEKTPDTYEKIVGDARKLPFEDKSFDFIIMNGLLHHLGFARSEKDPLHRIEEVLREAQRVARREIIVYEPVLPKFLEKMENGFANVIGSMPTYMFSIQSIESAAARLGMRPEQAFARTLSQLTSPLYWYIIIMDYPWLKFPAILSPVSNFFFILRVSKKG